MYAHYTETRNHKEVLITRTPTLRANGILLPINDKPIQNIVAKVEVKNRREARRIAADHKATCWNF